MKWLRLYTDLLDDPKMQKLSAQEFRIFIYLLCHASELDKDGRIQESKEDIAWRLRVTVTVLCDALVTLSKCHIVTDNGDGIEFLHWKKRQFKMDSSAKRTRRWREKKKAVTVCDGHGDGHSDSVEQNRDRILPPIVPQEGDKLFDIFWLNYPRKVGRGAALKAWKKIKSPNSVIEKMKIILPKQKLSESWMKDNGQYIPNPATYLNQRRWEDETIK